MLFYSINCFYWTSLHLKTFTNLSTLTTNQDDHAQHLKMVLAGLVLISLYISTLDWFWNDALLSLLISASRKINFCLIEVPVWGMILKARSFDNKQKQFDFAIKTAAKQEWSLIKIFWFVGLRCQKPWPG